MTTIPYLYEKEAAEFYSKKKRSHAGECVLSILEEELWESYYEKAMHYDLGIYLNLPSDRPDSYQITYGGMMYGQGTYEMAYTMAMGKKGFLMIDIDREAVHTSIYEDILFFPQYARSESFVPFAALMRTGHTFGEFERQKASYTLFFKSVNKSIWKDLATRTFFLALRYGMPYMGERTDWVRFIDTERMLLSYSVADLYVT